LTSSAIRKLAYFKFNNKPMEHDYNEENYEREKRQDSERWERYQLDGRGVANDRVDAWLASLGTDAELPCPK